MKRPYRRVPHGIKCILIGLGGILLSCCPDCLLPLSLAVLAFGILCILSR